MPNRKITSNSGKNTNRNRDVIYENSYIQVKDNKITKLKGTSVVENIGIEVRRYQFPDGSYFNAKVPSNLTYDLEQVKRGQLWEPTLLSLREVVDSWKSEIHPILRERLKNDVDIKDFIYDMVCIQDREKSNGRLFPTHTNKLVIEKWFYKGNMPKGINYSNFRAALDEAVYILAEKSGLRIDLLTERQKTLGSFDGFIIESKGIIKKFKVDRYRKFVEQVLLVISLPKNSSLRKANWDNLEFGDE